MSRVESTAAYRLCGEARVNSGVNPARQCQALVASGRAEESPTGDADPGRSDSRAERGVQRLLKTVHPCRVWPPPWPGGGSPRNVSIRHDQHRTPWPSCSNRKGDKGRRDRANPRAPARGQRGQPGPSQLARAVRMKLASAGRPVFVPTRQAQPPSARHSEPAQPRVACPKRVPRPLDAYTQVSPLERQGPLAQLAEQLTLNITSIVSCSCRSHAASFSHLLNSLLSLFCMRFLLV
jgi:hypothetical protein